MRPQNGGYMNNNIEKCKEISRLGLYPKHRLVMALLIVFGKCLCGLSKNLTNNQKLITFNYVQCNYNQKSAKKCCDDAEGCAK